MTFLKQIYNNSIESTGKSFGRFARGSCEKNPLNFPFFSETISKIPFAFGMKFRKAFYASLLSSVGTDVTLLDGVTFGDFRTIIGNDVWLSSGVYVEYANIEDHVLIGQQAVILAGKNHHNIERIDIPIKLQGNPPKTPITIGSGAWVGANATVMADVGHDSIVGAGAVVTKPVPPFAIVGGNPAKIIRMRK